MFLPSSSSFFLNFNFYKISKSNDIFHQISNKSIRKILIHFLPYPRKKKPNSILQNIRKTKWHLSIQFIYDPRKKKDFNQLKAHLKDSKKFLDPHEKKIHSSIALHLHNCTPKILAVLEEKSALQSGRLIGAFAATRFDTNIHNRSDNPWLSRGRDGRSQRGRACSKCERGDLHVREGSVDSSNDTRPVVKHGEKTP